eukprot:1270518-Rhodomonas_salina.1
MVLSGRARPLSFLCSWPSSGFLGLGDEPMAAATRAQLQLVRSTDQQSPVCVRRGTRRRVPR